MEMLRRPVVPLYANPSKSSGKLLIWWNDCVEQVLSLWAKLDTSDLESEC